MKKQIKGIYCVLKSKIAEKKICAFLESGEVVLIVNVVYIYT